MLCNLILYMKFNFVRTQTTTCIIVLGKKLELRNSAETHSLGFVQKLGEIKVLYVLFTVVYRYCDHLDFGLQFKLIGQL